MHKRLFVRARFKSWGQGGAPNCHVCCEFAYISVTSAGKHFGVVVASGRQGRLKPKLLLAAA